MTPKTKKLLLIAGGAAALLGVAALAAPFFIPWDKVKDQVAAEASRALGRELSIGKVELSLFTGVTVRDIRLANAGPGFSEQPLFSNAAAKLNVSLLSLFTGKVVVNSITFQQPSILVETNTKGVSNLEGLGSQGPARPRGAAAPAQPAGEARPLPIVLAALHIQDGQVVIRDLGKRTETAVKGLDLKLFGLSLAAAGGSRLELKLDGEVEGKRIPLSLVSNFRLDLTGESLDLRSLELKAPALQVNASGGVQGFKAPVVDLKTQVRLALAQLQDLLPPSVAKGLPPQLKTGGNIALDLNAKGPVADLKALGLDGALSFAKVSVAYGDHPALTELDGRLGFDKAGAELPALSFKLAGDPATLGLKARWGDLENLLGGLAKLKANVELSLRSPKLNLDPVVAIALAPDTPEDIARKAAQMKDLRVPDLRPQVPAGLNLKAVVEVDSLVARQIKTGKLRHQTLLRSRVLQTSTDLGLYQGAFWERTRADFNTPGPVWGAQAGLDRLDLAPFLADAAKMLPENPALKELDGKLKGALGFKADLKGRAFTRALRFRNLQADGEFYVKDGELKQLDVVERLAASIPHPPTQAVLRGDIVFANAVGRFSHSAERFTLRSFTLGSGDDWRGGDVLVQASGWLVPGGALDFKVVPRFNPRRVRLDGALAAGFNDEAGWASYDHIAYYGPTAKQAKADFKAGVKKAAQRVVEKKVEAVKEQAKEAVQQKVQEKAGEVLQKLPGLFGR